MTAKCDHVWRAPTKEDRGPGSGSVCDKCGGRASSCFAPKNNRLTFIFPNADIAADFKSWLCGGGGEQKFQRVGTIFYSTF